MIDVDTYTQTRKSRKRKRRQQNREKRAAQNVDMDASGDNASLSLDTSGDVSCSDDDLVSLLPKEKVLEKISDRAQQQCVSGQDSTHRGQSVGHRAGQSGGHRAGYDAFMTGFIYAAYRARHCGPGGGNKEEDWRNKLYLCGKDYPLVVRKSDFCKQTKSHLDKMCKLRKMAV